MICHKVFNVSLFSWICITLISLLTLVFSYCMLQAYNKCKCFSSILLHYMLHVYVCSLMWMYLAKFVLFFLFIICFAYCTFFPRHDFDYRMVIKKIKNKHCHSPDSFSTKCFASLPRIYAVS